MPFCTALTNHCCVDIRSNYRPCCHFDQQFNQEFSIFDFSFDEYKNSQFFINLKKEMEEGWASGCHKCEKVENQGIKSLRQNYNEKFSGIDDRLEFIDMSVSNTCNLTCKMCNDLYSSRWQSVLAKTNDPQSATIAKKIITKKEFSVSDVFYNLNLKHLKEIKYLGGEPFITKEIKDLFNFLRKENIIDKISFRCNTNCTVFPKKLISELLGFQSIRIDLSIDGIDELCNFVRTGKGWKEVSEVVEQWIQLRNLHQDKIRLNLHHTSNAYNLHQFDIIQKFAESKNLNFNYYILRNPIFLSYQVLPKEYILEIIRSKKLTKLSLIRYLRNLGSQDITLWNAFIDYTRKTDLILNTNISDTIPELSKYFTK